MTFFERLEKLLIEKQIKKSELARMLGFERQRIQKWKARGNIPRAETLKRISEILSVSVDFLLDIS